MSRKLPAFAKALIAKRRKGLAPVRDLLISADWSSGKAWSPWRIVVAPDDDPAQLDFSICAGLSCLLCGNSQARLDTIARAIIPFGPKRLIGAEYGGRRVLIYLPADVLQERAA